MCVCTCMCDAGVSFGVLLYCSVEFILRCYGLPVLVICFAVCACMCNEMPRLCVLGVPMTAHAALLANGKGMLASMCLFRQLRRICGDRALFETRRLERAFAKEDTPPAGGEAMKESVWGLKTDKTKHRRLKWFCCPPVLPGVEEEEGGLRCRGGCRKGSEGKEGHGRSSRPPRQKVSNPSRGSLARRCRLNGNRFVVSRVQIHGFGGVAQPVTRTILKYFSGLSLTSALHTLLFLNSPRSSYALV